MIAKDIQSAKVIIEGKGEKAYIAASWEIDEIREVFDLGVLLNVTEVIKMKGSGEGIGVLE